MNIMEKARNDYYEDKLNELKATSGYKKLSEKEKQEVHDVIWGKVDSTINAPVCNTNSVNGEIKVMNNTEIINSFRGLGYDNLVEDGLRKRMSPDDVAINILNAMPEGEIERRQAINYMANYVNKSGGVR